MDVETRLELIKRVGEEIVTEQELRELLETKNHPIAYDGFEPSGTAHIAFAIYRAINLEDLIKAGIYFKLWVADWFGWINNKMGGDLEKIKKVGEYFIEVWKATGVPTNKVEFLWASDAISDPEYWKKVILIAKNTTLNRAIRCLSIMGRKETELKETVLLFYPMMQCADIFHLKADICQLGVDQRRVNMLAREVGPKLGWWKPVVVSHHMLMGLQGMKQPEGFDENKQIDVEISSKMSKSKPETCIFVHDTKEDIKRKIGNAFCPEKVVDNNPILEYTKYIIFRKMKKLEIERPAKYGGNIEVYSYGELEKMYREGKIHPLDLKNAVSEALDKLVKPIRKHFEKNKKARDLLEAIKSSEV
ncbi:MAG: tyrosine--tRNA ligase [Candidatus Aenigmarchaeota archaeon]|nr:tyrosine--tRNA ligase [Candidatus Aenigmarchaeota archaeon]